jgi:glutaminase
VASSLIRGLYESLVASGARVLFAGALEACRDSLAVDRAVHVSDVERAVETYEDDVLGSVAEGASAVAGRMALADFPLLSALDAGEIAVLEGHVERRVYEPGEPIIRDGAVADALYFIEKGAVEIRVLGGSGPTRLGTVEAGNIFGEMALLGGGARTAEVVADTHAHLMALAADSFAALARTHPRIERKLLVAIGRSLAERLRRANREIGALMR